MTQLDEFIAAVPRWRQPGIRALLTLAARPRGLRLLQRVPPLDQAAAALLGLIRYDDPAVSTPLGWDPEQIAGRGRELRRREHRP